MDKQALRRQIAQLKRNCAPQELTSLSATIMQQVAQHPRFLAASTVLLYHALPDEVQTALFIEEWAVSKRLILPVVKGEVLELHQYTSSEATRIGAYGICEPVEKPFTDFDELDLALVPGVAFDAQGGRLGRGKGYYDRLFAQLAPYSIYKIGVCFPFQRVDALALDPHDVAMNEVIS